LLLLLLLLPQRTVSAVPAPSRGAGRPGRLPGRNAGGPVAVGFVPFPGARRFLVWAEFSDEDESDAEDEEED
jgi:hypothetical protein